MMELNCGKYRLDLSSPVVMGILNITPDSFSDGGKFFDTDVAIAQLDAYRWLGRAQAADHVVLVHEAVAAQVEDDLGLAQRIDFAAGEVAQR